MPGLPCIGVHGVNGYKCDCNFINGCRSPVSKVNAVSKNLPWDSAWKAMFSSKPHPSTEFDGHFFKLTKEQYNPENVNLRAQLLSSAGVSLLDQSRYLDTKTNDAGVISFVRDMGICSCHIKPEDVKNTGRGGSFQLQSTATCFNLNALVVFRRAKPSSRPADLPVFRGTGVTHVALHYIEQHADVQQHLLEVQTRNKVLEQALMEKCEHIAT